MDLYGDMIRQLLARKREVDIAIAALEKLEGAATEPKRRGRKFMRPEERQKVSAHMKNYWAKRKEQGQWKQ